MAINFQNVTLTPPSPEHGSLAAARMPFLNQLDSASLQAAVTALGFTSVGTDQYQHADGSWVALNNGRIERGYNNIHFRGMPTDLMQSPSIDGSSVGQVAACNVAADSGDTPALRTSLQAAGFAQTLNNYYAHSDGSWVSFVDQQVVVGYGSNILTPGTFGQPAPPPAAAPAASNNSAAATPTGPTADGAAAYPAVNPTFEDGFTAAAQLPFLRPQNLATDKPTFLAAGFKELSPKYFEHADGSWVAFSASGTVERGRGQQKFQGVPVGISRLGSQNPGTNHLGLAIGDGQVARLTAAEITKSDKVLLDKGFTQSTPNVWVHADQSFVAVVADQVHFGHQQVLFTGSPHPAGFNVVQPDLNIVQQSGELWGLSIDDAAKAKKELVERGFSEDRPGFFQSGRVWALIEDKSVVVGFDQNRLESIPTPSSLPSTKSSDAHKWTAIAQTADLKAGTKDLAQKLGDLGFSESSPNFFTHADQSWVALEGKKLLRGVDGNQFSDVPKPPDPSEVRQYTSLPAQTWDWWVTNNQAIAQLPIIGDDASARGHLQRLNFQQVPNSSPERWQHLDGSYVTFNGRASLGWQKWTLGQLPFNNRISQR